MAMTTHTTGLTVQNAGQAAAPWVTSHPQQSVCVFHQRAGPGVLVWTQPVGLDATNPTGLRKSMPSELVSKCLPVSPGDVLVDSHAGHGGQSHRWMRTHVSLEDKRHIRERPCASTTVVFFCHPARELRSSFLSLFL